MTSTKMPRGWVLSRAVISSQRSRTSCMQASLTQPPIPLPLLPNTRMGRTLSISQTISLFTASARTHTCHATQKRAKVMKQPLTATHVREDQLTFLQAPEQAFELVEPSVTQAPYKSYSNYLLGCVLQQVFLKCWHTYSSDQFEGSERSCHEPDLQDQLFGRGPSGVVCACSMGQTATFDMRAWLTSIKCPCCAFGAVFSPMRSCTR
ncbi:hypothetical protein M409DRAFT_48558 [Zasmidium cellare ATCC 36951]|uniref:Uncharacterized protein n=1 Tax=Zasmidium cellare ATCC 36951 TaxID=1080233 RepID=A0A6A6D3C8_ZASCE|nr:uncharacterized protein M409DRAFT_48558 [Zasmidium cellare ATCC 36951]KAF2173603.1 hypothetical protein M409DRAFT_48558 [Zasmidium cellare ATCC 36951]